MPLGIAEPRCAECCVGFVPGQQGIEQSSAKANPWSERLKTAPKMKSFRNIISYGNNCSVASATCTGVKMWA
jgi:hypothetical protein